MFNQAIRLSTAEYGSPEGWDDYWNISVNEIVDGKYTSRADDVKAVVDKYITSNMKILTVQDTAEIDESGLALIVWELMDGSAFAYTKNHVRDIYFFPKNWQKCLQRSLKDASGSCVFNFIFYPQSTNRYFEYHYKKYNIEPFMCDWDGDIKNLYNNYRFGCKSDGNANGMYCTAIIKNNNWKIPNDYPRKIQY